VVSAKAFAQRLLKRGKPSVRVEDKYKDRTLTPTEIEEWLHLFEQRSPGSTGDSSDE
jgi:hypothetical protein